jgi:membrane protease YdiL (CAAX protease family)
MKTNRLPAVKIFERIVLALVFVSIGGAIMIVFKPWGKQLFNPVDNFLWRLCLIIVLLAAAWMTRRSARLAKYWQIVFAVVILSIALSVDWILGNNLSDSLHVRDTTPAGFTMYKLDDFLAIVPTVIVFTLLSGGSLGSIYIQKGRLKLGLIIGGIAFLLAAAGSIPMAKLLFQAGNLTLARVLPWTPWVLLAALANGALEELLFRGLFLRKLQPFFGKFLANVLIALVFTVLHQGAYYTSDQYIFLAATALVALAWGYLMQKTDSVWGSILFHAGMDIPIFLGIFANL